MKLQAKIPQLSLMENDWTDWNSAVKLRKQLQEEILRNNKTRKLANTTTGNIR